MRKGGLTATDVGTRSHLFSTKTRLVVYVLAVNAGIGKQQGTIKTAALDLRRVPLSIANAEQRGCDSMSDIARPRNKAERPVVGNLSQLTACAAPPLSDTSQLHGSVFPEDLLHQEHE
jgi:hypothetical protein